MVPVVIACQMWSQFLKNSVVMFHVDNQSIMYILQSQTSSDIKILFMLRRIVLLSMLHNFVYSAEYVSSKENVFADLLSRSQVSKAREWAPWLMADALMIRSDFTPWYKQHLK